MQSFICDLEDLEVNPMKLRKARRNVIKASSVAYKSGSYVLNSLKLICSAGWQVDHLKGCCNSLNGSLQKH